MLMSLHTEIEEAPSAHQGFVTNPDIIPAAHRTSEPRTFELPMAIWYSMFACYAVFFGALLAVTGRDAGTVFVIMISMAYAVMYFGTAALLNSISPKTEQIKSKVNIDTYTGPMSFAAAYAQILTVPILVAVFGCVSAIFYTIVTP
jgi:hypothetical protein